MARDPRLLAALAAALVLAGCGGPKDVEPPPPAPPIADESGARAAAATFVDTAVARKRLAASWPVTHPALREGYTRAQWVQGTMPVQYVPGAAARPADFVLAERTGNELGFRLELAGRTFFLNVKPYGDPPRWGVTYFAPAVGIPEAPGGATSEGTIPP